MTKEEKIKEAYGEYWESAKDRIDENGFDVNNHKNCQIVLKKDLSVDFMIYKDKIRPKSLQGIEDNNGWIKIESEEQYDELENGEYEWYNINNGKYDKGDLWTYGLFTHYKIVPITKPELPIY